MQINYKMAGVDIEAGNQAVLSMKNLVESTFSPQVLTPIGGFGAMYELRQIIQNYSNPVLVQSIDGVGTKMMVAKAMQKFDTIGIDLVAATANDIIVLGATPLTLLDYIANDKLNPDTITEIIQGIVKACLENNIALVGGETAEMPGTYLPGEVDLVGVVTGIVEKDKAILGHEITEGDVVCCLASSGLHTNGFSLARKILFELANYSPKSKLEDFNHSLGEELLIPHVNYTLPILSLISQGIAIKGMAHITGGGLLENIPRILAPHLAVEILKKQIPELAIFKLLQHHGKLEEQELYRTFNMGAGLVLVTAEAELAKLQAVIRDFPAFKLHNIGRVIKGNREVILL